MEIPDFFPWFFCIFRNTFIIYAYIISRRRCFIGDEDTVAKAHAVCVLLFL